MDFSEISESQISYIYNLLEQRRVSAATASKMIEMLLAEPYLNDQGMDTLKKIQRPT